MPSGKYRPTASCTSQRTTAAISERPPGPCHCDSELVSRTLQLAISDVRSTTPAINKLCKARAIVGHLSIALLCKKRLHDVQRQLNKNVLHVVQDVETR